MRKKVLLVDDSATIHKIVELTIDRRHFELISAYSVGDAEKLKDEKFSIILLDNKLFKSTPENFLTNFKDSNNKAGIVLLIGAYDQFFDEEHDNSQIDDYLVKPFSSTTLNQVLKDIIAKKDPYSNTETETVDKSIVMERPLITEPLTAYKLELSELPDNFDAYDNDSSSGGFYEPDSIEDEPDTEDEPDEFFDFSDTYDTESSPVLNFMEEPVDETAEPIKIAPIVDADLAKEPIIFSQNENKPADEPTPVQEEEPAVLDMSGADTEANTVGGLSEEANADTDEDDTAEVFEFTQEPAVAAETNMQEAGTAEVPDTPEERQEQSILDDFDFSLDNSEPAIVADATVAPGSFDEPAKVIEPIFDVSIETLQEPEEYNLESADAIFEDVESAMGAPEPADVITPVDTEHDGQKSEVSAEVEGDSEIPSSVIDTFDMGLPFSDDGTFHTVAEYEKAFYGDEDTVTDNIAKELEDEMQEESASAPKDLFSSFDDEDALIKDFISEKDAFVDKDLFDEAAFYDEPGDVVTADDEHADPLHKEITERHELMSLFDELNLSFDGTFGSDKPAETQVTAYAPVETVKETVSHPVEPEKAVSAPAVGVSSGEPVSGGLKDSRNVTDLAAKLTIELSKKDLVNLLEQSVNKDILEKIIKEVLRDSIEDSVGKIVHKLAEKMVREELRLLKGGK